MRVLTTGEVSRICKVSLTTVNKWFDSGKLKGYRVPGSRHRRIPRENLVQFLRDHGVPLGELAEQIVAKILVVSQDPELLDHLNRDLQDDVSFVVSVASSGFEAGIQAEELQPDCIVIDFDIGASLAQQVCQNLRHKPDFADTILIAVLPTSNGFSLLDRTLVNETMKRPFDPALLSERIRTLVSFKKEVD